MDHQLPTKDAQRSHSIVSWVLIGFVLTAGYFLVLEHRAHLGGALYYLPYVLLLACPVMHLFMHHGHHAHREHPQSIDHQQERK